MSTPPDLAITLARFEVKLDTIIGASSDHETRIRALEAKVTDQPNDPNKHSAVTMEMFVRALVLVIGVVTGVWVIP